MQGERGQLHEFVGPHYSIWTLSHDWTSHSHFWQSSTLAPQPDYIPQKKLILLCCPRTGSATLRQVHPIDSWSLYLISSLAEIIHDVKMRDPFPPPNFLVHQTRPVAELLSLSTLPYHAHEILLAWASYHLIEIFVAPLISQWLLPATYARLSPRTKSNWNIRVVSIIQATFVSALALYVIRTDDERRKMDWRGRIWGYTGGIGMVQGFAAGYFLWDLASCLMHFEVGGWQALAHAVSALIVTTLGFVSFTPSYFRSQLSLRS